MKKTRHLSTSKKYLYSHAENIAPVKTKIWTVNIATDVSLDPTTSSVFYS